MALVASIAVVLGPLVTSAVANVSPSSNTLTISAGSHGTEDKVVGVPSSPPAVDIELAIDTTGSMGSVLTQISSQAMSLVNAVHASYPGARFAVAQFKDHQDGLQVYTTLQSMTANAALVSAAIPLSAGGGGSDAAEAYSRAFHESYTPAVGGPIGWAAGSRKFVVVIGDAQPHNAGVVSLSPPLPGCTDTVPDTFNVRSELNGMAAAQRTLFMVRAVQGTTTATLPCYQSIAAGAYPGGAGVNLGTNIAPQIVSLINASVATVSTVALSVVSASPSPALASWASFNPASAGPVTPPVNIGYTVTVNVPTGTPPGTYTFDIVALADGADIGHQTLTIVVPNPNGTLKVCKVAGPGVALNTTYTFGGFGTTAVIPAGPAPGGFCKVVGTFAIGSNVAVNEVLPSDTSVAIAVSPPSQQVGTPNLTTGSVLVAIGPGVTEVTFTNRRTGFIEICKESKGTPAVTGAFDFTIARQTYTIPVGVCTGPIELPLGPNVITESFKAGTVLVGCTAVPSPLMSCTLPSRAATVNVVPGGIAAQEIVTFTNSSFSTTGGGCCGARYATEASATCAPNPTSVGEVLSCAVAVQDTVPNPEAPTGLVTCSDGSAARVVGAAALGKAGLTNVKLVLRSAGAHLISCTYKGDAVFAPSTATATVQVVKGR